MLKLGRALEFSHPGGLTQADSRFRIRNSEFKIEGFAPPPLCPRVAPKATLAGKFPPATALSRPAGEQLGPELIDGKDRWRTGSTFKIGR